MAKLLSLVLNNKDTRRSIYAEAIAIKAGVALSIVGSGDRIAVAQIVDAVATRARNVIGMISHKLKAALDIRILIAGGADEVVGNLLEISRCSGELGCTDNEACDGTRLSVSVECCARVGNTRRVWRRKMVVSGIVGDGAPLTRIVERSVERWGSGDGRKS